MSRKNEMEKVQREAVCILTYFQLQEALENMAKHLTEALSEKEPIIICVMIGGLVPLGQLLPKLNFPLEIDYLQVSRYGNQSVGGELKWVHKPKINLNGRTVLIFDDILDEGVTLSEIVKFCLNQNVKEVYTAVLVNKLTKREEGGLQSADFVGLNMENKFVFGFGLDYENYHRNLPGIYTIETS